MAKIHETTAELEAGLASGINVTNDRVRILDEELLEAELVDDLVHTAVFGPGPVKDRARWIIRAAAHALGVKTASTHAFYVARGTGESSRDLTVPAFNIRGPTYDVSRAAIRAAKRAKVGAFIFEIARSEIGYTDQRPGEYAAVVAAAAIREGFRGPLFLQGDHYQFSASKYPKDPAREKKAILDLIDESVAAGFRNIDIDASTLVDLSKPGEREQQRLNATLSAEMCAHIRRLQPPGVVISVGGEIGEVGAHVTTPLELEAYMETYREELSRSGRSPGPSKISINTGTSHGGKVDAAGKVTKMEVRFDIHDAMSRLCREKYGLGGTVQHGASTLAETEFDKFPPVGTIEIHLATGFQNLLFDHPAFPKALTDRIRAWVTSDLAAEKKEKDSQEQFIYKTRKKAFGRFKKELWGLEDPSRSAIMDDMEARFTLLFKKLGVEDTQGLANRYAMMDGAPPVWSAPARGAFHSEMAAGEGE
ncbi:MAG: class II fructose-bisphosphate aldolase [Euryarchaeota archaeon]|nr:class II fructose-bisphosphate aldolase [Euryarchaeota archaeon]